MLLLYYLELLSYYGIDCRQIVYSMNYSQDSCTASLVSVMETKETPREIDSRSVVRVILYKSQLLWLS